jgi:Flp pilus assembly protein TadB
VKSWHLRLGAFLGTVVAMYAIAFHHSLVWVAAAAVVVVACSFGVWLLERKQGRTDT